MAGSSASIRGPSARSLSRASAPKPVKEKRASRSAVVNRVMRVAPMLASNVGATMKGEG
jgi:hypothetical protein